MLSSALGGLRGRRRGGTLCRGVPGCARRRGAGSDRISLRRDGNSNSTARVALPRHRGAPLKLPTLEWEKMNGLVPAIIQDASTGAVLMLGYMNREALAATEATGRVTFWSRSKGRLWTKGETSGHHLELKSIAADCDGDTLLILADPKGPACHMGTATCWGDKPPQSAAEQVAF